MKEPNTSDFISLLKRIPELRVEDAVEAIGGSESLYIKTLMQLTRLLPSNIVEMDKFLYANDDLRGFGVKVHGLKSALRSIGETRLSSIAESLEKAAKSGDRAYCAENCDAFMEGLRCFYKQVRLAAVQSGEMEEEPKRGSAGGSDIGDFTDALIQARDAADFCDSIAASEILLPLTKLRFGGNADDLILKAANALDMFKPQEAFDCITELLKECGNPPMQK